MRSHCLLPVLTSALLASLICVGCTPGSDSTGGPEQPKSPPEAKTPAAPSPSKPAPAPAEQTKPAAPAPAATTPETTKPSTPPAAATPEPSEPAVPKPAAAEEPAEIIQTAQPEVEKPAGTEKPAEAEKPAEVEKPAAATPASEAEAEKPAAATPEKEAEREMVVMTTEAGVLVIDLYDQDARLHTENFRRLVREGFYNGKTFHRVVKGFIAQAGDRGDLSGPAAERYDYVIAPENSRKHEYGSVAMALSTKKDAAGASDPTQFFICYDGDFSELKGTTVFGKVVRGLATLDRFHQYVPGAVANQGILPADQRTKILKVELVAAKDMNAAVERSVPLVTVRTPPEPVQPPAKKNDDMYAVLTTNLGDIVIDLFEKDAPKHAANFKKLVEEGFYNGLTFHRVIDGFMAQGGDPKGDGTGGPGYRIPAEIGRKHERGSVAAARQGGPINPNRESSGSQFYICFKAAPHLDGAYTVFGKVVSGMEVVDQFPRGAPGSGLVMPPGRRAKIISAKMVPASDY